MKSFCIFAPSRGKKLEDAKIGKIIFAKVLEMPLKKYLTYVQEMTDEKGTPFLTVETLKKNYLCENNG